MSAMTLMTDTKEPPFAGDEERWQAVLRRDHDADRTFFYGVLSTGVFCRPSCPSRAAKRENLRFFESAEAAKRAGFRACKRCRPEEEVSASPAELVARACRSIEAAEEIPSLGALATEAGLSRFHFQRLFKAATGVTPKAYAVAVRAARVRRALTATGDVTTAIYESGFNSSGRFYEAAQAILGMTPAAFRTHGADMTIRFAIGQSSLGNVLVAATERGICAITMGDDPAILVADLKRRFAKARLIAGDQAFECQVAKAVALVETPARGLDLPLDIRGTAFQQQVWQALRDIPPGSTASYADVALRIGRPAATRAVAQACAANPIGVAIPCHRVVRSDGSLSGYHWGIERKRELLARETNK